MTDSSTYAYYGLTRPLASSLYELRPFRGEVYRGYQGVRMARSSSIAIIVLDYDATRAALAPYVDPSQTQALLNGVGYQPSDRNTQSEKTYTAYGVARFGTSDFAVPFDGNIGLRVVKTKVGTSGFESRSPQVQTGVDATTGQPIFGNGPVSFVPISVNSDYTKFLPSVNLTFHLTDKLQLRLAGSKALTRPDFTQLNPNVSINEFVATGGQRVATSGNANLKPLTATQFDASLEYYFSRTDPCTLPAFTRRSMASSPT